MRNSKNKFNTSVELLNEKTGEVVRIIRFRNKTDFDYFLNSFKAMRYPGFDWRYLKKPTRKVKPNEEAV